MSTPPELQAGQKIQKLVRSMLWAVVIGVLIASAVMAAALKSKNGYSHLGFAVTICLFFFAAMAAGCFLGFLFGLPRSRVADLAAPETTEQAKNTVFTRYLTNSNLIKVSDWLTTIIVGLGLTNLPTIASGLGKLGNALAGPLGSPAFTGANALSVVIVGAVSGFVLCYLWTTVRLRELLEESEARWTTMPNFENQNQEAVNQLGGQAGVIPQLPAGTPADRLIANQSIEAGTPVLRGQKVSLTPQP